MLVAGCTPPGSHAAPGTTIQYEFEKLGNEIIIKRQTKISKKRTAEKTRSDLSEECDDEKHSFNMRFLLGWYLTI